MVVIDKRFPETPVYGAQQMTGHLQGKGHAVTFKRIGRRMRLMPIHQTPDTGKPAKGRQSFPDRPGRPGVQRHNQVWCTDITHLPMRRGSFHLVAIMGRLNP